MLKFLQIFTVAMRVYDAAVDRIDKRREAKREKARAEEAARVQELAEAIRRGDDAAGGDGSLGAPSTGKDVIDEQGVYRMAPGKMIGGVYYPRHFSTTEFNQMALGGENWWPLMEPTLVAILDTLRDQWGGAVVISPVLGALGRRGGKRSDHNVDVTGTVRAADVFVHLPSGEPVNTREKADAVVDAAVRAGANAIGVYPHWINGRGAQQCGFHIGWRADLVGAEYVASWGMVRDVPRGVHRTTSLITALARVGKPPGQ
jgi:hypothetical protein